MAMATYRILIPLIGVWALASTVVGCSGVLGIEKAEHDEKLDRRSAGGQSGNSGGAGGATTTLKPLCERYCDAALANCSAEHSLYTSRDVCLGVCRTFDPGQAGDDGVNTAECRLRFAIAAGTVGELDLNCPAAGPGGDGHCGTNCEGFCTIARGACSDSTVVTVDTCAGLCAKLPDQGGYTDQIQSGNSVQCRLYHASAATFDPRTHCAHVAGIGACKSAGP